MNNKICLSVEKFFIKYEKIKALYNKKIDLKLLGSFFFWLAIAQNDFDFKCRYIRFLFHSSCLILTYCFFIFLYEKQKRQFYQGFFQKMFIFENFYSNIFWRFFSLDILFGESLILIKHFKILKYILLFWVISLVLASVFFYQSKCVRG